MKIRISLVNYLNAAPLGWSFLHGPLQDVFEVFPSSPARCAEQLSKGEVDIGLIPSIEFQRIPGLQVIPGIAIAAHSKVRSILLARLHDSEKISSVALDNCSCTSAALTKVLLKEKLGVSAQYYAHSPNLPAMLKSCSAALVIGDAALKVRLEDYNIMDLAEEWVEWQRRPFVFAFWASRIDSPVQANLVSIFQEAKEWGLQRRSEIASVYSKSLNLPQSFLERYLFENIDYDMGPDHIEGLEKFYQLAKQENLIPEIKPLLFRK
jgi:chorismate dehydratase